MLVIDASAAVELLLSSAIGGAVAQRLGSVDETLHAPELIGVEVTSVLRRLTRIGEVDTQVAERAIREFGELGIEMYEHLPLLSRVFALRHTLTAYDACYLALAEGIDAPLLTCDANLARAVGHTANVILVA